jgi:phage terminase large subunit-like protein
VDRVSTRDFERFAARCGLGIEPFQKRIWRAVAGPERECVILLPRGSGKSALLALVALHHLTTTERARVFCAAASREQARILYEYARDFARELGDPHLVERHLELRWCEDAREPRRFDRYLRVLAADATKLHGLTFTLAILDELQAHSKLDVYEALNSALHKQPDSKMVVISTAGQGAESPLGALRRRALAQPSVKRRGAVTDARGPDLRFLEWACAEDDDVDNPRVVKRANPASWVTVDQLRAARASLPDLAHRRYVGNQWGERAGHWLPPGAWEKCIGEPSFEPGERIWVGVDVGGERSATALAWLNESRHVGIAIFHGEGGILEAAEAIKVLAATYTISECTFDPWRAAQLGAELAERGITASSFPQTDQRMIPASSRLRDAIVRGKLVLPDDAELRRHAANAVARQKARGWRIEAPDRSSNVDAVISLAMALDRFENQPQAPRLIGWL